ncbi:MAG: hypothetical protein NTX49_07095 [Chlamydiae bacterium]|nr:hypothetical protein [Chlamydiota bacterium]
MSGIPLRTSYSAPDLSMLRNSASELSCKADYKDRHFLVGSTDAVVEIFLRSRAGLLPDGEIKSELSKVIAERKLSIEVYRRQKKEKQFFSGKGSDLTRSQVDSHAEMLFIKSYARCKCHLQQKTHLGLRIEHMMRNLHEQGPGLKRIFGKREEFSVRKSLPMYVSISLQTSSSSHRRLMLSGIAAMPDIAEPVARHMVELESQLSSLKSRKVYLRDRLLEAIESFQANSDAIPAFQKIVRENRELDVIQSEINALAKRLIVYRGVIGL